MSFHRGCGCSLTLCSLLLIAGCHKRRIAAAPPPPPIPVAMVSVPPPTHPSEPEPSIPLAFLENIEPQLPRRSTPRYRPPAATAAQIAALTPPLPVPVDLGQLTAGGESANSTLRQQTEDLLRNQQRRLAALAPSLASSHAQQVQQARLFLRQADEAWKKLDVEGARTLATKAKVLLDELLA